MRIESIKQFLSIRRRLSDRLMRNSLFLMLTSLSNAGFGFLFWFIAAQKYIASDVGIGAGLLSSIFLIVLVTRCGLDLSLIRYLPTGDKNRIIGTSITVTTILAIIIALFFIIGIDFFSPDLGLLKSWGNIALFLAFILAESIVWLIGLSFVAIRRADLYFILYLFYAIRVVLLLLFVSYGAIGILCSLGVASIISVFVGLVLLARMHLRPVYKPERSFLRESLHFSFGNYIGQTFIWAPTYLLPLLILGTLGAQQAAYYYVAYSVFTILSIVPNAISTSLFVEGSHGENLEIILRKSIRTTLLLLTPLVVVVFIGGKWILSIFGLEYAMGGLELLQVISLASYFVALNYVYIAVLRIRNEIRRIVFLSFIILVSLMSSATILSSEMGLIGIGYSWIIAYGLGCIAILFMIMFPKEEGIP